MERQLSVPIDELIQSILSAYGLSNARVVEKFASNKRNDSFLIEGRMGARYILRRYRRNRNPERIDFQLRFQQHIHAQGFPTSEVVQPDSDRRFVTFEANHWALFTYVRGHEFDFTRPGQAAEAASRLAQFHELAESFTEPEVTVPYNADVRRWRTRGSLELERLERMFFEQGVDKELQFLRMWMANFVREFPLSRLDALPVRWVHGDYHGRNMVFSDDTMQALFDFDPLHRGFRIEDLGDAVYTFGRESRGSFRLRLEVVRLFLNEYERSGRLDEEEWEALPRMVVGLPLTADYYELLRRDGEDISFHLKNVVRAMESLQAELPRLSKFLGR